MSKLANHLKAALVLSLAFTVPNVLISSAWAKTSSATTSSPSSMSMTKKPLTKSTKVKTKHKSAKKTVTHQAPATPKASTTMKK